MTEAGARTPRSRTSRLAFRFGLWLCLGATLILVGAGAWNIALQREHMIKLTGDSAHRKADVILRSTREAMLANDPEGLRRILETIGSQPGIERIRIFDKQGLVDVSTDPADVGQRIDIRAEECTGCHRADQPLERLPGDDRVREFVCPDGHEVLGIIAPIRNEPACTACHVHPAEKQVLGVLDVQLSLESVDEQLVASETQLGLGLMATVAAMLLLAWLLTWRLVLVPVAALHQATQQVSAGDLSVRAEVQGHDEIGAMVDSWNGMVDELGRARDELERWSHTLELRVDEKTAALEAAHQRMLMVEKMASLGKLAAVVAHEINNPLAGIATYARLLLRRYERARAVSGETGDGDEDETAKALTLVEREAVRCGDIVRNLLLFSRTPSTNFAETDIAPLIERCAMLVRHKAELVDVDIVREVADELPPIECDGSQVQQLVLALAMNAIEAMPDGGTLTLQAAPCGEGLELTVEDTGCGIPADRLAHVFEPFYTTKREGHGVGLGLAVVYGIVQRHHGHVSVDSTVDAGTRFRVVLPREQPDEVEPASSPTLEEVLP